jgi:hypothetical protein
MAKFPYFHYYKKKYIFSHFMTINIKKIVIKSRKIKLSLAILVLSLLHKVLTGTDYVVEMPIR